MKLVVVVENYTYIDEYYLGEPALCFYIEDGESKIVFDTGYSDVILHNAAKLGINLNLVSTIAISHGHNDHTNGLQYVMERFDCRDVQVIAHPDALKEKVWNQENIGAPYTTEELKGKCKLQLTKEPVKLSENIIFLGEIPRSNTFEECNGLGEDKLFDDTALVYQGQTGLFLITGCSHSGICNIIEYAKKICNNNTISGVIGGFHLFDSNPQLQNTIQYLKENKIMNLYPCHCVSFAVKAKINETIPIHEVGVGLRLEIS